ncbi:response regulator [Dictyobacter kobayashii]|uniref:Response regulatory domain-containing protein n=1 Tax=Dictyobacter kobayashii TaxID=2014872 RepID=A0A402AMK2_9CHLR|nr:response regulator [Dictyobacter kobayashii]GCE20279.1 hypothetical protein KDK_40790 [Dictyobacter kobayashii]
MSDVWRIIVVASDDALNQNLVNSLRKDGYVVQGMMSEADAVRTLWSEEYDVVIYDVKTPGADGFELLQWLRAYRPSIHTIMLGETDSAPLRMQALEGGAVSYFEKPLDIRLLKEELRRLLQPTGFSASLDSFDLLDVIQIVNMSRKSITLLINTGLEERGVLRFQNGELIWAEYGVLRAEEAFFALAAHKNGTVIHQPWNDQVASNVTQPLSRLIFQALQYRTKYANRQQYSGEIESVPIAPISFADIDDTPFMVLTEAQPSSSPFQAPANDWSETQSETSPAQLEKEWWENTGRMPRAQPAPAAAVQDGDAALAPTMALNGQELMDMLKKMSDQAPVQASGQAAPIDRPELNAELPGWLTDQPTSSQRAIPKSATGTPSAIPATPNIPTKSSEWPAARVPLTTTEQLSPEQMSGFQETEVLRPANREWSSGSPTQPPVEISRSAQPSGPLYRGQSPVAQEAASGSFSFEPEYEGNISLSTSTLRAQQAARRNYATLVSALQTLGYSVPGFIAAAVVTIDGQPVAQVAIDEIDISRVCRYFSAIQKSVLLASEVSELGGEHEHTVVTSAGRQIFMRMAGIEKKIFQVLITTREADPAQCVQLMTSVEETISTALQ